VPEPVENRGTTSDGFKTNGYAVSVNGGSTTSLSYDLNGNMTSDGTNSYSWDAENRMIKITYPGTNNFSSFVYDGLGRNVSIAETTAGSVTSTKQFVWCRDKKRRYQPCEERDASGALTKKFFERGQMNSATKYFYDKDHLGSVRELTDNSGAIQAQYVFDPYGRVTKISETVACDFGYAGYYAHSRSNLDITGCRLYAAQLGRWLSRDPAEDRFTTVYNPGSLILPTEFNRNSTSASDLYLYTQNNPINYTDLSGLCPCDSASSPPSGCTDYGSETYQGVSETCVCTCMGNSSSANAVRGCLLCEKHKGVDADTRHEDCLLMHPDVIPQLIFCGILCTAADTSFPGRTGLPPAPPPRLF
jgi:RHS repeat-associated protein